MSEHLKSAKNTLKKLAKGAAVIGAMALAGCGGEGIHSKDEARKVAVGSYLTTFHKASPAGKFVLQYLRASEVDVLDSNGGFFDDGDNSYHKLFFNNGCLQNTAYDIAGGAIHGEVTSSFLFGSSTTSIDGKVPTAAAYAYVDSAHPNILLIKSGHASSVDLHFSGVSDGSDHLTPLDKETKDVLATYGCESGLTVNYAHASGYQAESVTSDYIIRTSNDIRPKV